MHLYVYTDFDADCNLKKKAYSGCYILEEWLPVGSMSRHSGTPLVKLARASDLYPNMNCNSTHPFVASHPCFEPVLEDPPPSAFI
jgi:hypothetical protein